VNGSKWVYIDGSVGFANEFHEAALQAGRESGMSDDDAQAISNLALVGGLDPHRDMAMGIIRSNRPQIYVSNVDRNWVFDTVRQAM
jgi:hypothetical protein